MNILNFARAMGGSILLSAACGGIAADSSAKSPLKTIADIPLPGDTSRFDYESYDAGRHLLFIAHLGASEVLAFDTQKRQVVGRIAATSHVHGVLAVPELKRLYASATGTDEVVAIDADTLAIVARIPAGKYPDGMAYAPDVHKLYVSDETGEAETVIDVQANRRIATIAIGGEVGNTQYDPGTKHIFVNVQTRNQLVEIDPATDKIIARNNLPGADGNHGLLIDAGSRLALIACEGNNKLLAFDLDTHQVKATFDVGGGPDVLAEDESLGLIYVAAESGPVALFKIDGGRVTKQAEVHLAPNAHVVAVDATTHFAYFPIKNLGGHPVLKIVQPVP